MWPRAFPWKVAQRRLRSASGRAQEKLPWGWEGCCIRVLETENDDPNHSAFASAQEISKMSLPLPRDGPSWTVAACERRRAVAFLGL